MSILNWGEGRSLKNEQSIYDPGAISSGLPWNQSPVKVAYASPCLDKKEDNKNVLLSGSPKMF